ncbi:MAG: hypothetical protein IPM98_06660 [Lewinellaceae bacterium]|nr:hypothetical protein [Lewinellaceae bacterium]
MTKAILVFTCLLGALGSATAQNQHLKLYLGFELADRPFLEGINFDATGPFYKQQYATNPFYALAFSREKANGNFWEISGQTDAYLGFSTVYDFTGPDSIIPAPLVKLGEERNNFAQLQFEYNWLQGADNGQKIRPYLGIFLRASAQWATFRPSRADYYERERWRAVVSPGFVPRILIKTGGRWHLDLSAPIVLGYFGLESSYVGNPVLTSEQQRSTSFDLSGFNLETQIRLGVAYSLNKPAEN